MNDTGCTIREYERHYDESPDRPDMQGVLIPGRRGRLLAALYTAAGPGPHPAVLLLHGIPGCERNFDLAQVLRRAGFHVLVFHYSGSWGSDGDYSLTHDLEDAGTALDFLLDDARFRIDKERIFAVGHSLGGFVCGQLTARRQEVRGAALLMPCDIGRLSLLRETDGNAFQSIRDALEDSAKWLNGTSGEALLREAIENSTAFSLEAAAARLSEKPLLCIGGTLDCCTPPAYNCEPLERAVRAAGGKKLQSRRYVTDHFFADYRLTIAREVTEFLKELCQ